MLKAIIGDITNVEGAEYICNAANAIGIMGAGVAGAIRKGGGYAIQEEALKICRLEDPDRGGLYLTGAGKLPYKGVIHLVTMKKMGERAKLDVVENCLDRLIAYCKEEGIERVALPALGTGVGRLDKDKVAYIYVKKLRPVEDVKFLVVDINAPFIQAVNGFLK